MSQPIEVLAGGDVIVNRDDPLSLFALCKDDLVAADIVFANCETTYSTRGTHAEGRLNRPPMPRSEADVRR